MDKPAYFRTINRVNTMEWQCGVCNHVFRELKEVVVDYEIIGVASYYCPNCNTEDAVISPDKLQRLKAEYELERVLNESVCQDK